MSLIRDWSTTPANNELTIPFGAPITWYPSEVSPVVRQHMADHRTQWEDAEWFNWGHVATQTSATTFTVPTNLTAVYFAGRRIKIIDTTTLYGVITSSTFSSPNTIVTVLLDSGSLSATMNGKNVFLSILTSNSVPAIGSYVGQVITMATATVAPTGGWFLCDGTAKSRTVYSRLFTALGVVWGPGDGSTTFNIPDFRGEFLRGHDNGRGVDPGRVFGAHQDQAFLSHVHGLSFPPAGGYLSAEAGSIQVAGGANAIAEGRAFPGTTNAMGGTETRPRNQTVGYYIKY